MARITSTRLEYVEESGEWVVRAFIGDKRFPAGDYFADDSQDAADTAREMTKGGDR